MFEVKSLLSLLMSLGKLLECWILLLARASFCYYQAGRAVLEFNWKHINKSAFFQCFLGNSWKTLIDAVRGYVQLFPVCACLTCTHTYTHSDFSLHTTTVLSRARNSRWLSFPSYSKDLMKQKNWRIIPMK